MNTKTFILAPDSFKESMTAKEVCISMEQGLKRVYPDARYIHVPMADGGEGTLQSLIDATGGNIFTCKVSGPLGELTEASYGIMGGGEIAVIEMASASGLHLVPCEKRNPLLTSTCGTGQLIKACLDRNIKKIILGIGGSATNDGGAGMAEALGVRFYDKQDQLLPPGGGALADLHHIDTSGIDHRLSGVQLVVACDVTNPLCGEYGASRVFGPQKGATPDMIVTLDAALKRYATVIRDQMHRDVAEVAGAGAAGGLGAGLMAFTECTLERGIDIVIRYSRLREQMAGADYCFTGEGRIDSQTRFGKTPLGVAGVAKEYNVPVIAVSGCIGDGIRELYDEGISAIFAITPGADTLGHLLASGKENMTSACENIGRLINVTR